MNTDTMIFKPWCLKTVSVIFSQSNPFHTCKQYNILVYYSNAWGTGAGFNTTNSIKVMCTSLAASLWNCTRYKIPINGCRTLIGSDVLKVMNVPICYKPYNCKGLLKQFFSTSKRGLNEYATIFSLSSGHGKCGVAVVRNSGQRSAEILHMIAQFKSLPLPRQATLRKLIDPCTGLIIDKGLVLYFPKPHSFTGEDCVEFQIHGGPAVVNALLMALSSIPGCRQAEPGEFTKRAFLNGKLDLTEVEGLGDLIHAETEAQRRQALRQMDGDLSRLYSTWRKGIIKCVADIEAFIDFGEDQEIEEQVVHRVIQNIAILKAEIRQHVCDDRHGERLREGVHVVILGEPNVGKSSLFNAICQRPAAIVNEVAGTTRDVIEVHVNIGGYPVLLSDTAGLRDTEDHVEREGVHRALKQARLADIRILVFDLSRSDHNMCKLSDVGSFITRQLSHIDLEESPTKPLETQMMNRETKDRNQNFEDNVNTGGLKINEDNIIVVLNKQDISKQDNIERVIIKRSVNIGFNETVSVSGLNSQDIHLQQQGQGEVDNIQNISVCSLSCVTGDGLDDFLNILKTKVEKMCGNPLVGHPSITQARHRLHLTKCLHSLDRFDQMITVNDIVLASEALRSALKEIGKVTGKITSEEILDVIFRDFCIGK